MSDERREKEPRVLGVLLTHGAMAEGMVDAVRRIAGTDAEAIRPVSNEGRSPERLQEELESLIGTRTAILFTDLHTGSCAVVARLVCRDQGRRAAVFGVNLAMLLDFVFHRDLPLADLVSRVVGRGKDAVRSGFAADAHADRSLSG